MAAQESVEPVSGQAQEVVVAVPEPSVGICYGHAWSRLWKNFGMLLLVVIITAAMHLPGFIPFGGPLYGFFVMGPVIYGVAYVFLKATKDQDVRVGEMFTGFSVYGNVLLAQLLVGLIVVGGLILLIVPGIICGCKLAFVPYLVVERKLSATDAIRASWKMTTGHAMTVFLILLTAIPILIGGVVCLVVGVIPAAMWVHLAVATLYFAVSAKTPTAVQPA